MEATPYPALPVWERQEGGGEEARRPRWSWRKLIAKSGQELLSTKPRYSGIKRVPPNLVLPPNRHYWETRGNDHNPHDGRGQPPPRCNKINAFASSEALGA